MSARKNILIVDDDQALRQSLAEQLHMYEEFSASEAATGRAALNAIKGGSFDLILLDIGLPDMDGRERSASWCAGAGSPCRSSC